MAQKPFAPITSIFDSVATPWALAALMLVIEGAATYWVVVTS